MKYIIITGGVLSGLGKGITTSSIGRLLKCCGLKVTAVKIDPYLNCDAGTMSPFQHGEVFVLHDGGEVDLDLGNYERFLDTDLSRVHNITTGKVYRSVIEKERKGEYLGKTVQIIPHITNEIRYEIKQAARESGADVTLVELGGTVGDIESMPFLEAVRQLHIEVGHENLMFVHTTLVPIMGVVGEQKTKPTQHSVKELRAIGIIPDMVVCRCEEPLEEGIKEKLALFCDVKKEAVISAEDARSIYHVPYMLHRQGVTKQVIRKLELHDRARRIYMKSWKDFVKSLETARDEITIAIVGKYTHLKDSYVSIKEALLHAGAASDIHVNIDWVEGEHLEKGRDMIKLRRADGILIPGGFGDRGTEGKIRAVNFARTGKKPFIGLCLGFQLAVVEYCRNMMGMEKANSTEFDPETHYPAIDLLPEQLGVEDYGGTMRLGGHRIFIDEGSLAHRLYGKTTIVERHRHRYEVNPKFIEKIEAGGLKFTGRDTEGIRMEICELPRRTHPYFIASQFHPEFLSRPNKPSPMFLHLVLESLKAKKKKEKRARRSMVARNKGKTGRGRGKPSGNAKARGGPEKKKTKEAVARE